MNSVAVKIGILETTYSCAFETALQESFSTTYVKFYDLMLILVCLKKCISVLHWKLSDHTQQQLNICFRDFHQVSSQAPTAYSMAYSFT